MSAGLTVDCVPRPAVEVHIDAAPRPAIDVNVNIGGGGAGPTKEIDPTVPAWAKEPKKPSYTAKEVGALPDTTVIPTKVSELVNDAGYMTEYVERDPTVPNWAKQAKKPTYTADEVGALPNDTFIPSKVSQLNNDSAFITKMVSDLTNYYTKSETYSKSEVDAKVSAIPKFAIAVVDALPTTGISDATVYLVKDGDEEQNLYVEYINVGGVWEKLGEQAVDLTGYATETWVNVKLAGYQPKGDYALQSDIPVKVSELANDKGYIMGYTETDPTVPAWAKATTKPSYAKSEIGLGNVDNVRQYSSDNPPPYPVTKVNGKTGDVKLDAEDVGARASTWMPTHSDVGADKSGTAASAVSAHNTKTDAHNDIRLLITTLTTRLDALANSDDDTLDQMAEVVAYIKSNRNLIEQITTGKVSVSDIVNNLTTNVANKPLSAAQGVALKTLIDAIAIPTKLSQLTNDKGYITGYTETDPTVPAWAKSPNKPSYTADEVGALSADKLPEAINEALADAKTSGEFDGQPGKDGVSVTVKSVSESTADGGSNVVTFSDGKTVTIKNGSKGSAGENGKTPVVGTDYFTAADKSEMVAAVKAAMPSETWTFTLSDGSKVTKKVVLA